MPDETNREQDSKTETEAWQQNEARASRGIKLRIDDFEEHINTYRTSLNNQAIWLFVATLGCWSVNDHRLQTWAIWITIGLFFYQFFSGLTDKRPFSDIIKDIEDSISQELSYERQQERLDDLADVKRRKLSMRSHLRSTAPYMVCFLYLLASIWYFGR